MMTLIFHKCIVLVTVLAVTLLAGIAPWLLLRSLRKQRDDYNISQKRRVKYIFSCLNMFSGGVFLGVCFMHMLPEVREQMTYFIVQIKYANDFPATEFLVVVGFFLVVIIEILVSTCLSKKHTKETPSSKSHREYNRLPEENSPGAPLTPSTTPQGVTKYATISIDNEQIERNGTKPVQALGDRNVSSDSFEGCSDDHSDHSHLPLSESDGEETMVRSVLLFLALSLHTIFDGLSLGLQEDTSKLYSLFTGVIIHKILVGFTLGLQIFEYSIWTLKRSFCMMVIFACVSPIGMAIGIMIGRIQGHEMSRAMTSAVLNGLATGTFLYVTFIEIIGRELLHRASVVQVLFAIAGFGLMTGLVFNE